VEIIGRVDCLLLNDEELRQLTGKPTVYTAAQEILGWGPSIIVAKQGAHGATLVTADSYFSLPAYPLELVVDPTGAGDTFAGGFVGFIASHAGGTFDDNVLRNAMAYGTSLASYTVQRFGTESLQAITPGDVDERVANLWSYGRFDLIESALRA
jgi:sugar/nucleoside kinase (ribokinase family)